MPFSGTLHRLLLAGAFFWVYSNPVPPLHQQAPSTEDRGCAGQCIATVTPVRVTSIRSVHLEQLAAGKSTGGTPEHETPSWTDLLENVEAGGGAGPDGRGSGPGRFAAAMQAGNEDSHGGGSGPSRAGEEPPQGEETRREPTAERAPGRRGDIMEDIPASMSTFSIVSPEPEGQVQKELAGERRDTTLENRGGEERGRGPSLSSLRPPFLGQGTEATRQSSTEPLGSPGLNRSVAALTSTPESLWAPQEEVTGPSLPDQLLPDLGPALASRQEGLETLWTEPLRQSGEHTAAPASQDVATEGTMSSEDLPLIFEPFDDVTPEGPETAAATLAPRGSRPPAAMATGGSMPSEAELDLPVTVEDDGPSRAPPPLLQDWTSSWQTSGAEILEPISPSAQSIGPSPSEVPDEHMKKVGGETIAGLEDTLPSSGPSPFQTPMATVTMATDQPAPKLRSGLEELESEEEPDEGEEDENTEESDEESEEDLTEAPVLPPTHPPYSLMPPPPVWVQRNQGLMRSWVEQIREKAGYVSGMLAPVGIGIAGALLIVGALYSIRMIHRKRRNSFKHQRRKVRQTEQPREPGSNRQDQAMLLADSSEDEF